jgi:1,4-alpha-glucan branching enzyme
MVMNFRFLHYFILALILSYQYSFSQVVTTVPVNPTEKDSIVIFFNAKLGNAGLKGFTGTVYAYTGVITNQSANLSNWLHILGSSWTDYQHQPVVTRIGTDSYLLVIGNPRKFYSVNDPNEHILQIAILFKNADGSLAGREVGDANIYVPIYSSGVNIILKTPTITSQFGDPLRAPVFAGSQDTVNIKASAIAVSSKIASITLFVNGVSQATTTQDSLSFQFFSKNYSSRTNLISIIGVDTSGKKDSVSFLIFKNPIVNQAPPPAGIDYGINYNSDQTSATLMLFAPRKSFIYVLGDFNDWKVDTSYIMNEFQVRPDSVLWWLTINNLTPGTEYAFQYLIDGNLRVADIYSDKILDPDNDGSISPATYPNLKPYPSGKTQDITSVLQTGQAPYNWQVNNFKRPARTDLVIYELLIRDFISRHDYKTLTDTIGYLKRLGINAIELMPVMEFEGNDSWGYNVDFHMALDKYYGPKNDLKHFVDVAHANGMAVILDIVLNQVYELSPLVRMYWDPVNNRPAADNPWMNLVSPNPVFSFGYDINHESLDTKFYVDKINKYWLQNFHVDGYRFDFTKGFTNTPGDGSAFDPSRIAILERMANKIWAFDSTAYVILEHFGSLPEETILSNNGMMLWNNMNGSYQQASMGYQSGPPGTWDLTGTSYTSRGWSVPNIVSYMESHDEERLMYQDVVYGNSSGGYNIKDTATALNRIKLCEAFFYSIPGPKMLWQFGELGYDYSINYLGRLGDKPIRWDYFSNPNRLKLYKTTAALINLKLNYPAFKTSNFTYSLSGPVKTINLNGSWLDVIVVGNFDVTNQTANVQYPVTGAWFDYFSGDSINVTDLKSQITLGPGEMHIYTSVKLPAPEQGLLTNVTDKKETAVIHNYDLKQNYPNPFNPTSVINYQIPKAGIVKLKVYDILGREVAVLVNDQKPAGEYSVTFNANRLSSGVYFYTIQSGTYTNTKKMILLK